MCIQLKPPFSRHKGIGVQFTDEPTGNLDGENTQNIMDILCELAHKKGYCVILVTHDMEVAEMADVSFRMKDGNFVS